MYQKLLSLISIFEPCDIAVVVVVVVAAVVVVVRRRMSDLKTYSASMIRQLSSLLYQCSEK